MKNIISDYFESLLYMAICLIVYNILVHYHIRPYYPRAELGFWSTMITWCVTLYGGEFIARKVDRYLLKRDAIKVIIGLGHKKSDIEKIEIFRDGDAEVVEIILKDEQGEKK